MKTKNKQIAKESIEWHIISMAIEFILALIFFGHIVFSLIFVLTAFIVKSIFYFFFRKANEPDK